MEKIRLSDRSRGKRDAATLKVGAVRYIKLGPGRKWARDAIDRGIVPFDFRGISHDACNRGHWEEVRRQLVAKGRNERALGDDERELKEFYSLGEDTLWFTIAEGYIWWTFAQAKVLEGDRDGVTGPPRFRRVRTPWRNTSLTGLHLTERSFSSALSRTASYQRTICAVPEKDYLLRRIRGQTEPLRVRAEQLIGEIVTTATDMVRRLDWRDFETLVDLIFAHGGYKRQTALGGNQPEVDFLAKQPLTGNNAWVQVKSKATQAVFDDYLARFRPQAGGSAFFFVYHSARRPIRTPVNVPDVHVWPAEKVAEAAVDAGLFRWLAERVV